MIVKGSRQPVAEILDLDVELVSGADLCLEQDVADIDLYSWVGVVEDVGQGWQVKSVTCPSFDSVEYGEGQEGRVGVVLNCQRIGHMHYRSCRAHQIRIIGRHGVHCSLIDEHSQHVHPFYRHIGSFYVDQVAVVIKGNGIDVEDGLARKDEVFETGEHGFEGVGAVGVESWSVGSENRSGTG